MTRSSLSSSQLSSVSGARRSELLALRWTDVDLGLGTMTIRRAIVAGPAGVVEKDTKTHSARRVALDARTVSVLREYRQYLADWAASCGVTLEHNCLVFASDVAMSRPCYPDSVSRRFRYACRKAGVEGVRLHDLRHYVATRLLSAGVDVRTVAGRLGHRSAATTLNVYSHLVPESDREAAEIMSGLRSGEVDRHGFDACHGARRCPHPTQRSSPSRRVPFGSLVQAHASCARRGRLVGRSDRQPAIGGRACTQWHG